MKSKTSEIDCKTILKTSQDPNLSLTGSDLPEPASPILSLNEVSSSRQDPPEHSRSPSPSRKSPSSFAQPGIYDDKERSVSPPAGGRDLLTTWPPPPLLASSPLVPLVFPYHSAPHSVIYMNPFLHPCQATSVIEKKKRNRTFIDPVTEVFSNSVDRTRYFKMSSNFSSIF